MNLRRLLSVIVGLALAAAVGLSAFSLIDELRNGDRPAGVADIGGSFTLVDHQGETVSDTDFRGRHMLVYFGYTFCPDVCPTELQNMSAALDQLGPEVAEVRPVFITIDPGRDTPQVLADYRQHFHAEFATLTGSDAQIAAAAKAYRVYYAKAGETGDDDYLMDHSSFVYLMDGEGRYVTHFRPNTAPEIMVRRIRENL